MKNKTLFISAFFCILMQMWFVFISCRTEDSSVDCSTYDYSDCNTTEPVEARLHVKLTINSENTSVPLTIYTGKLEENAVYLRDTVSKESYDTLLPVGNYYTVSALYRKGDVSITAVDGDKISKSKRTVCDSVCWSVKEGNVNLKLK
jgi:hypothetical protein